MDQKLRPEEIILQIRENVNIAQRLRNELIEEHFGFVVHTISKVTGRYVEVENSEELSIGLMAFNEAIERFEESKGASFLTYAHLVIASRLKDYFSKVSHDQAEVYYDGLMELDIEAHVPQDTLSEHTVAEEIEQWESILLKFGFDLDALVDETPKHEDTRNNAIELSQDVSREDDIVNKMYEKYRLPVTLIVVRFQTTKKIVTRSKKFIIATVVVLTKKYNLIRKWIYKDGRNIQYD